MSVVSIDGHGTPKILEAACFLKNILYHTLCLHVISCHNMHYRVSIVCSSGFNPLIALINADPPVRHWFRSYEIFFGLSEVYGMKFNNFLSNFSAWEVE